ncbi:MAG TPA: hypothetical protein PKK00_12265 [Bacteroidales bacterium]|nr:hypothetical protein [Bacteroidales bacterium]HPS17824.1 hypothetical protein [Bacteroidales bacterium]
MRKLYTHILIILFLLNSFFIFSQDIFICDTAGITKYTASSISFKCNYFYNFIKASIDSALIDNSNKVPVTFIATTENRILNGPIFYFRNDSVLVMQGFMKNGKPDSTFILYHISLENYKIIAAKTFFRNGLKEGKEIEYSKKGVITSICHYKNGKLDGDSKQYDEYGNLLKQGSYVNGKREGDWIDNDLQKHYYTTAKFKNDKILYSNLRACYENGKTFVDGNYDKYNKKNGVFYVYDTEGFIVRKESYRHGRRNGNFYDYDKGKLLKRTKYKNDKIVK